MIHKSEPSQLFLDSIHAAFHLAQGQGEITPSAIWDHVVGICLRRHIMPDMFAWDVRRKPTRSATASRTSPRRSCRAMYRGCAWR